MVVRKYTFVLLQKLLNKTKSECEEDLHDKHSAECSIGGLTL